jgi:hypothetical protein
VTLSAPLQSHGFQPYSGLFRLSFLGISWAMYSPIAVFSSGRTTCKKTRSPLITGHEQEALSPPSHMQSGWFACLQNSAYASGSVTQYREYRTAVLPVPSALVAPCPSSLLVPCFSRFPAGTLDIPAFHWEFFMHLPLVSDTQVPAWMVGSQ